MNLPEDFVNNPVVTHQPPVFNFETPYPPQSQWENNNSVNTYQLPLQLSQYYNVFPDVPSTKTSWTFPNGCVTSSFVRFTGAPTPTYPIVNNTQIHSCKSSGIAPVKRKSLSTTDNETVPSKIFISEEKMAARMNEMHISNEFVSHMTEELPSLTDETTVDEEFECEPSTSFEPKLVMCDELKNLNKDVSSFIPEPIVPFEKPSTALVLWRPPSSCSNLINILPEEEEDYPSRSSVIITDITDRPDLDNNNISTVDLNTIISVPSENQQVSMEIMEM